MIKIKPTKGFPLTYDVIAGLEKIASITCIVDNQPRYMLEYKGRHISLGNVSLSAAAERAKKELQILVAWNIQQQERILNELKEDENVYIDEEE